MAWVKWLQGLWDPISELEAMALQDEGNTPLRDSPKKEFLRIRKKLGSPYPGNFLDIFKGHGLDLQNLREYQPGDEIRKIDWNVFARTGTPHIKEHFDEKQVPIWFVLDITTTMHFGQKISKLDYAGKLLELIGFIALQAGHHIGLILWNGDESIEIHTPSASPKQLQWILQKIASHEGAPKLATQLPDLPNLFKNRCLVFFLSDFHFLEKMPDAPHLLSRLSRKHDLRYLLLVDPTEETLIKGDGFLPFKNEAHDIAWVDLQDKSILKRYQALFSQTLKQKEAILSSCGHCYHVCSDNNPHESLLKLVKRP